MRRDESRQCSLEERMPQSRGEDAIRTRSLGGILVLEGEDKLIDGLASAWQTFATVCVVNKAEG